jgi:hypothetical protein
MKFIISCIIEFDCLCFAEVQRGQTIQQHIIVGTPGKVSDWAFRYNAFDLSKIKVFVLDEADVMIIGQGCQTLKMFR